jgi:creatinine amidohydrolase/Fe(II)-dependent formamide hydrolase-like protein
LFFWAITPDVVLVAAVGAPKNTGSRGAQRPKPGPADGVYGGDPRRSTAGLGEPGIEAIVSKTVNAIRKDTVSR